MESLDSGFLAASSALPPPPLVSLNRSRSPWPAAPPPPPPAGACVGVLAGLLELAWRETEKNLVNIVGLDDDDREDIIRKASDWPVW